ncbi:MAG: anthranilate phosphoribosyltransferase [Chloroflexi bacterium]|nr:anthranilate phosphoribosyltransferase [Chloroflexota bacterium]
MIKESINKLVNGIDLTFEESEYAMNEIMEGEATPAQFGAFVVALKLKGESIDEVAGMASSMRSKSLKVDIPGDDLLDTCGTGGDHSGTFNISTVSAFVASGAGAKVAKHGNRAMSGSSGSADVLEALGAQITLEPDKVKRCIQDAGFGFMFAQNFHPSMRFAASPRREIAIPTVFNILGPLTNPAGASNQMIGVSNPNVGELMANVLRRLGTKKAVIVHGKDGLDEITVSGDSILWILDDSGIIKMEISPEEFGFSRSPIENIKAKDSSESALIIRNILSGSEQGPSRDIVIMNSAVALFCLGIVPDIQNGIQESIRSIDSGEALNKLEKYVQLTKD